MTIEKTRVHLLDSVQHPVQFSYFYGFEPYVSTKPNADGRVPPPKYGSQLIIGRDHPQVPQIVAAIAEACRIVPAFASSWQDYLKAFGGKGKIPMLPGEVRNPGAKECAGKLVISTNAKGRFSIVETRGGVNVQLTAQDMPLRPYSGAYGNAIFNCFYYKKGGGEGISAGLEGVQFTRHGEAFGGGRVAAPTEFGLVDVGASADAPAPAGAVDDGLGGLLGF